MANSFDNWNSQGSSYYRFTDEELGLSTPSQSYQRDSFENEYLQSHGRQPSSSQLALTQGHDDESEFQESPDPIYINAGPDLRKFRCPSCDASFKNIRSYQRHYRDKHWRKDIFVCFGCSGMVQYYNPLSNTDKPLKCCQCEDPNIYLGPEEVIMHFERYHFHYLWSHNMKYVRRQEEVNATNGHLKSYSDPIHDYISLLWRGNKQFFMVRNFRGNKFCDHCDVSLRDLAHCIHHRKWMDENRERPSQRIDDAYSLRIRNHLRSEVMAGPWHSVLFENGLFPGQEERLTWRWNGEDASSLLRNLEAGSMHEQASRTVLAERALELSTETGGGRTPAFNNGTRYGGQHPHQHQPPSGQTIQGMQTNPQPSSGFRHSPQRYPGGGNLQDFGLNSSALTGFVQGSPSYTGSTQSVMPHHEPPYRNRWYNDSQQQSRTQHDARGPAQSSALLGWGNDPGGSRFPARLSERDECSNLQGGGPYGLQSSHQHRYNQDRRNFEDRGQYGGGY